jgi:2,4-dienoyl-CoA reductase-like NADH-dependent reductase (Old Yellow Enzyme family)
MQRVREIFYLPKNKENTEMANMQADGFLLSQFLSSSSNKRSDGFGGSTEKRVEIILRILRAIRQEVSQSFCVGIKINTADHMNQGGFEEMLRQIELIHKEKPDYIQLSGGSFENPEVCSFLISPNTKFAKLMVVLRCLALEIHCLVPMSSPID